MPGQPQLVCPQPPLFPLGLDAFNLEVLQPAGQPSGLIIDPGVPWSVRMTFRIGGILAPFINGLIAAGIVTYTVTYYHEGFGGLPEGVLATKPPVPSAAGVATAACPGGPAFEYAGAATTAPVAIALPAGTYKLTAVVTFAGPGLPVSPPFTAFVEGPVIQIS